MNKEELLRLLGSSSFTPEDLQKLDELINQYPYFGIPRFIRLRANKLMNIGTDPGETANAVVYSGNREYLYNWVNGTSSASASMHGTVSELEFIDDAENAFPGEAGEELLEFADNDAAESEKDFDFSTITEKEETEMEEPEIEDSSSVPVLESLEDEEIPGEGSIEDSSAEIPEKPEIEVIPGHGKIDLLLRGSITNEVENKSNSSNQLIEQFLQSDPGVIKANTKTSLEGDVSINSVKEDDAYITDTLAKIYVKQGLHAKAIYAYERLSLKYPEKSAYFAAQIEKIKNSTNS